MHDWVSLLTALRKTAPELQAGDVQVEDVCSRFDRLVRGFNLDRGCASGSQRVLVIVNKAEHPKTIPLSTAYRAAMYWAMNRRAAHLLAPEGLTEEWSSDALLCSRSRERAATGRTTTVQIESAYIADRIDCNIFNLYVAGL